VAHFRFARRQMARFLWQIIFLLFFFSNSMGVLGRALPPVFDVNRRLAQPVGASRFRLIGDLRDIRDTLHLGDNLVGARAT